MGPCVRVWSREIGECLEWGQIAEAFEARSIVIGDEAIEEGIPILVEAEQPTRAAPFGLTADGVNDATVEAFDEAVGLRSIGPGEAVRGAKLCAKAGHRVADRSPVPSLRFASARSPGHGIGPAFS